MRTLFTASHFCVAFKIQGLYCKIYGGACNACNMRAIFVFVWSLTINTAQTCNTYLSTNVFLFPLVFRHCFVQWNQTAHHIWLRSNRQFWILNLFQLSHHRFWILNKYFERESHNMNVLIKYFQITEKNWTNKLIFVYISLLFESTRGEGGSPLPALSSKNRYLSNSTMRWKPPSLSSPGHQTNAFKWPQPLQGVRGHHLPRLAASSAVASIQELNHRHQHGQSIDNSRQPDPPFPTIHPPTQQ